MSSSWPDKILSPKEVVAAAKIRPPLTRFKCDCCRRMFDNEEKRRQMKSVPVDVCTGCVSKMETKH